MHVIRPLLVSSMLVLTGVSLSACQTSQPGVKSSFHSQWTTVNGNTLAATNAARDVLKDLRLENVEARSTALDGSVQGFTADNTKVSIEVKKVTDTTSQVSVNVGAMGDPSLGTDILSRLQKKLGTRP